MVGRFSNRIVEVQHARCGAPAPPTKEAADKSCSDPIERHGGIEMCLGFEPLGPFKLRERYSILTGILFGMNGA
jgi:hypothetical protein